MGELGVYALYMAIFLATILAVEGAYYAFFAERQGRRAVNRRLRMLEKGDNPRQVFESLLRARANESDAPFIQDPVAWGERYLTQSGVTASLGRVALVCLGLGAVTFMLGLGLFPVYGVTGGGVIALSLLLTVATGVVLPIGVLRRKRAKRMRKFAEQLADGLDVFVRSLRAGHPVNTAMGLVATEMPDPIGSEFGIAVDEVTYGRDLEEALVNMARRIGLPEFDFVVAAINTQRKTGGNLTEVLAALSALLRDRFRMFKKIRALSAEGRLSAIILTLLPVGVAGFVLLTNPDFYGDVSDDPIFWPGIGGSVALLVMGVLVMRRMVNFRV